MTPESPWIIDVDEETFLEHVMDRSNDVPVVVDFWAEWCGPCKMLGPLLEQEATERQGAFVLAKVNVDHTPNLAYQFGIQSIPLVVAFKEGKPVKEFMGVLPRPQLKAFLDEVAGPHKPAAKAAKKGADAKRPDPKLLEAKDPAKAEAEYLKVLEQDAGDPAANLGLARLALARGEDAAVQQRLAALSKKKADPFLDEIDRLKALLALRALARPLGAEAEARARAAEAPLDAERAYELGVVLAAAGRHEEALEALLGAAKRSKELARTKAREAMVHVFYVVGPRSALADSYRDRLSALVF